MFRKLGQLLLAAAFILGSAQWCGAAHKDRTVYTKKAGKYRLTAKSNWKNARAEVGKPVMLELTVKSPDPGFFRAQLFVNGVEKGKPQDLEFGKSVAFTETLNAPGEVFVQCEMLGKDKQPELVKNRPTICGFGVIVSPEKIVPGNPKRPADFDAFWQRKREELDKVPIRADRKEAGLNKIYEKIVCYDVQVDCSGDAPVSGYLCMPRDAKPKSLPAVVTFQGAGVYSAAPKPQLASNAIIFAINAHGIRNGQPKEYYEELKSGKLRRYRVTGIRDHNKLYFVGMYTRVMRALDYVKSLPEWDGKTLIAWGGSQGGAQSLAAAALDPQVSLCVATVPALCDLGAALAGRRSGWPFYGLAARQQTDPKIVNELAYVDCAFLAPRIKCPVYISAGLIDNTCIATSIFAAYNAIPEGTKKHISVNPLGGHGTSPSKRGEKAITDLIGE